MAALLRTLCILLVSHSLFAQTLRFERGLHLLQQIRFCKSSVCYEARYGCSFTLLPIQIEQMYEPDLRGNN